MTTKKDLKFRAWDKKRNNMFYIRGGDVFVLQYDRWELGEIDYNWLVHGTNHKDGYLMQYIGLKDINGKEIYESDIIKYDMYGDGNMRIATIPERTNQSWHRYGELQSLVDDGYYIEVIGNIYKK